ncbi:MAG: phosphoglycerate dehydrogenase, partial [Synergistales bacterium]|nr:phosphoglycerate dehydrogenase [Synergistales bacterium]
ELLDIIGDVDALVTRSGTPLDGDILSKAGKLKVVARAGVGVDNIDLLEASRKGVIIINAPTGNTLSAADHTMALMLSLIRKIPQAFNSIQGGEWKRSNFVGYQLKGKKLLIIGLGRIGSEVARRARSFGMEVMAYDPYIQPNRAEALGAELLVDLEGAMARADVITLHVPMTDETRGMICKKTLKACKKGSFLINCARGGLVDEDACAHALREGRLAGAAFDVYSSEPPVTVSHPLFAEDMRSRVVLTPHLGANTYEAQSSVANIAVRNLCGVLEGQPYEHAVNLPFLEHSLEQGEKEFLSLARKIAYIAGNMLDQPVKKLKVVMRGPVFRGDNRSVCFELPYKYSPFSIASLKGLLEVYHGKELTYMSAPLMAMERGLEVEEIMGESRTYENLLEIVVEGEKQNVSFRATVTEEGKKRILSINDYPVDFVPESVLLLFHNHDRPGVIGKIGTLLGAAGVNIANFTLGRKEGSGLALGVMQIDSDIPGEAMEKLVEDADLVWLKMIDLREEW